jgi:hypothetical protein
MNKEEKDTKQVVKKSPKPKKELFSFLKKKTKKVKQGDVEKDTSMEEGLNLMPAPSKEEIEKEGKKAVLNIGSAFSLLTLVLVSVFIISFNIMSKMELNQNKEELYAYEEKMKRNSQVVIDNEEIVSRIFLYKNIQEATFSPKEVIQYVEDIAEKSDGIDITSYEIAESLAFEFTGESQDLEKVSKFWYLLCNDGSILTINLDSVSKSDDGARFSFEGQFIFEDFVNITEDEDN